jgi:hypothetical protein
MTTIAMVKRDADLPMFLTLTYPDDFPDPDVSKKHLRKFIKRLVRRFPFIGLIWKLEPQQRGAPHYHFLIWGADYIDLLTFVPQAWYEIAGGGDPKHLAWHKGLCGNGNKPCVTKVNCFKGVWWYAAKYIGKTFEVSGWGVICRQNIPFGEMKKLVVTRRLAVQIMRYQRHFKNIRKSGEAKRPRPRRSNGRSLTIFCDATQWAERLYPLND